MNTGVTLRRKFVYIGITFLAIGIVAIVFSLIQVPFQEQEEYFVPVADALLEESLTVPVGEISRTLVLNAGDTINIDFRVTSGGNRDVNFYFRDGTNTVLSLVRTSGYNDTLTVNNNSTYYAVWDNSFSTFTQKGVTTKISKVWDEAHYRDITTQHTIIPSEYTTITEYVGIAFILAGIALMGFGAVSEEKKVHQPGT